MPVPVQTAPAPASFSAPIQRASPLRRVRALRRESRAPAPADPQLSILIPIVALPLLPVQSAYSPVHFSPGLSLPIHPITAGPLRTIPVMA